ncbi:redoxin domain-containing protein [Caballeronia sp. LjRoot31]|uniref:redoxin domain-containing protein n=1 Tax=Caballeronia sp. LjRoot31 TaxID=3342324 RepID=UPI003ECC91BC
MNISDLVGLRLPDIRLRSTAGDTCDLSTLPSDAVLIFLPFILPPEESPPEIVPTDRSVTGGLEQLLCFVRLHPEFASRGIALYGISTQSPLVQRITAETLALPFPLLSDSNRAFCSRLNLPMINKGVRMRIPRVTPLVIQVRDGRVARVFHPTPSSHYCATHVLHQIGVTT